MDYWVICNKCGHIFKTRKSRTNYPWKQRKQCNRCWSNDLMGMSSQFLIEKYKELIIKSVIGSRSDKYKEAKEILKDQRAAAKVEPQVSKMVPLIDQEKEPSTQYPECFGLKQYLTSGYGINHQDCFDCKFRSECKDKILS